MRKIFILFLIFMLCFLNAEDGLAESYVEGEEDITILKDVDVDFQAIMYIGTSQMIVVQPIPLDAEYETIYYSSSNPEVATVNDIGRIRAVDVGNTVISVTMDGITKSQILTVKSDEVLLNDLDIGDYEKKLEVGKSQLLQVGLIPSNATEAEIKFASSNANIASVNQAGRVKGIAPGKVDILISSGNIKKSISIIVIEEKTVKELDVIDFEKKMWVGKQQRLSVEIYPEDVEEKEIKFSSSNPEVADISSTGMITTYGPGITIVTVSCGEIFREMKLSVSEKTNVIQTNVSYLALHPGDKFKVKAKVLPENANQDLEYWSTNKSVLYVENNGLIRALKEGKATVIISNGDLFQTIFVTINRIDKYNQSKLNTTSDVSIADETEEMVQSMMKEDNENKEIVVNGDNVDVIDKDFLRALMTYRKKLQINYSEYSILIDGKRIRNPNNLLIPLIQFEHTENGVKLYINEGCKLPGELFVYLSKPYNEYTYCYYYNEETQKYERLSLVDEESVSNEEKKVIKIDDGGTYLLTNTKEDLIHIKKETCLGIGGLLALIGLFYIGVSRKYWFW